jgi:hypothetical protein
MDLHSRASVDESGASIRLPAIQALIEAEHALHAAQLAGDVEALHRLLHPEVRCIGPEGAVLDKESELEGHRSGSLRLSAVDEVSLEAGLEESTGVTRAVLDVVGVDAAGPFAGRFIYSRTWIAYAGRWVVLAEHAGRVAGSFAIQEESAADATMHEATPSP